MEDGIGLREGNGLDDWLSGEELLPLKRLDERENWENIPFEDIRNYESAFSYLDAKGMRFLMPQYMIADILEKPLCYEPLWQLERLDNSSKQFKLFNIEQIKAVIH